MSWLQNNFLEYYEMWLKIVDVQCKWIWFAWKSVPVGKYMYMEKKMAPGFTMAKEQTAILCQVAMLKKIFTWSKLLFTCWEFGSLTVFLKFLLYCVRVVCIDVMGIRANVHWISQNWNAAWTKVMLHNWKYRLQDAGYVG